MSIKALHNLSIIEYSQGVAGAMCSKAFGDLGAHVVKIEPPSGDPLRKFGPYPGDQFNIESSGRFLYLNGNKDGVTLDLTNEADHQKFQTLLRAADIFVTDLPLQEIDRLGIDSKSIEKDYPTLVAVYITPFGLTGPYSHYKANDLVVYHMGGLGYETPWFSVTDLDLEFPLRAGGYQTEYMAGWTAALATMIAVFYKNTYGLGQTVDISALECVADHIRSNFAMFSHEISQLPESRLKSHFPWIWNCADGYISTSFSLQHWWDALRSLMGNPDWIEKGGYSDIDVLVSGADDVGPRIAEWMKNHTRNQLFSMLQDHGIPCFPVNSPTEVMNSNHYAKRNFFVQQEHPVAGKILQPGPPVRMSETPWTLRSHAPLLGQHNENVFSKCEPRAGSANSDPVKSKGNKPLKGIRILDFGWILSIPHCTQWLGTMGAEVLRVESQAHPEAGRIGDRASTDGVQGVNRSGPWNNNNYSKLGMTLNLKEPVAIEIIHELVKKCDVVAENFAPDVMKRLGLDYKSISAVKPDIIYITGSTLGVSGPDYQATGWGPNTLSYGGLTSLMGYENGEPVQAGGNLPDYMVGTVMAFHLLSAISHHRRTGIGQYIEVSMSELVSTLIPEAFMESAMNQREVKRTGNHVNEMSPHNVYAAEGHDQWIAIAVQDQSEWQAFCTAIGRTEWIDDERFSSLDARKRNEIQLDKLINDWTVKHLPVDAMKILQKAGVAAGPVMSTFDLLEDPHFRERGFIVELDHPEVGLREVSGLPAKFSAMDRLGYFPAPTLGQHNDYVFRDVLGMDSDKIETLIRDKIIY
ncbi:MAG: CoA transferase [Chloroflexota bacterium]|nr:CoA transferase [Chloroflexota bacterium]